MAQKAKEEIANERKSKVDGHFNQGLPQNVETSTGNNVGYLSASGKRVEEQLGLTTEKAACPLEQRVFSENGLAQDSQRKKTMMLLHDIKKRTVSSLSAP